MSQAMSATLLWMFAAVVFAVVGYWMGHGDGRKAGDRWWAETLIEVAQRAEKRWDGGTDRARATVDEIIVELDRRAARR